MKRLIAIVLALVIVLSMCTACDGTKADNGLRVGFGRADITPTFAVGLHGYGNVGERQSQGYFNKLYATCVAITDENNKTVLLYTVDLIFVNNHMLRYFRSAVSEATGVPESNITASGTHTHSGPSPTSNNIYWNDVFAPAMLEAAQTAMADRSQVAAVHAGSTEIEGMNFVRHYITDLDKVVGDNFYNYKTDGVRVSHTTEVDDEMQLVRFVRKDKQDILMINWQGHPKITSTNETIIGKSLRSKASSDYIGTCRDYLEGEDSDLLLAFYLGASGNVNVRSWLSEEQQKNTEDPKVYGERLGNRIIEALPALVDQGQPTLQCTRQAVATPQQSGTMTDLELTAVKLGNIGFVSVPFEMFDTTGMEIKEASPCETTFLLTCSSGHVGYIPAEYAWSYYNCYEVRSTYYARGAAEIFADAAVEALKAMP